MAGLLKRLGFGTGKTETAEGQNRIQQDTLPVHVAIIMDGNGRWAKKRGLPRIVGHKAGADSIRDIVRFCGEVGIRMLTLYAFSTENWSRPQEEVEGLMDLLLEYLDRETRELHENGVCIRFLGSLDDLRPSIQKAVRTAEEFTKDNAGLQLNIAVNYGSRPELVRAVRMIADKYRRGEIDDLDSITEETVAQHLYTAGMPDPDLLIRPGGEIRISNFLLWQSAYTEFWPTDVLWPDFRRKHLIQAIEDYQRRERRFGRVGNEAGDQRFD